MRFDRFWTSLLLFSISVVLIICYMPRPKPSEFAQLISKRSEESIRKSKTIENGKDSQENGSILYSKSSRRTPYPPRKDMGECPKLFGKVAVFVAYVKKSMETHYRVAQATLHCYLKSTNYIVHMVDLNEDTRVKHACSHHKQLFFLKHCAAAEYLGDSDWMLVLDADSGIINPNHCIEEWIDDRVNLIFYERYFNWEIASGNYIVRNSDFSRQFLTKWADWEFTQPSNWNGADNGVLQIHILQTVLPDAIQESENCDTIWRRGTNYDTYMAYVTCVKLMLGATRIWPEKIRIYRRAHGWVRDGYLTSDQWSDYDFMLHGWKAQNISEAWQSPFKTIPDVAKCGQGTSGWDWRPERHVSVDEIRRQLSNFENSTGRTFPKQARIIPYLTLPDVGRCYPFCDVHV